jgi:hypothetical protein
MVVGGELKERNSSYNNSIFKLQKGIFRTVMGAGSRDLSR